MNHKEILNKLANGSNLSGTNEYSEIYKANDFSVATDGCMLFRTSESHANTGSIALNQAHIENLILRQVEKTVGIDRIVSEGQYSAIYDLTGFRYPIQTKHAEILTALEVKELGFKGSTLSYNGETFGLATMILNETTIAKITKQSALKNQLFSKSLFELLPENYTRLIPENVFYEDAVKNITLLKDSDTLEFSYLPKGKECILSGKSTWKKNNRQVTKKVGKLLRNVLKLFNTEISDNDLRDIVDTLKANLPKSQDIKIVTGETLKAAYLGENYAEKQGTLNSSCMRHESCQDYMDFYVKNDIELAVLYSDEGLVEGRAILWTTDNDEKVLDRIYGTEATIKKFKKYAEAKGMYSKTVQSMDSTRFELEGNTKSSFTIDLLDTEGEYPYMDSFKYLDSYSDTLSTNQGGGECLVLECTSGGYNDDSRVFCEHSEEYIDEDDAVYLELEQITVHIDYTVLDYECNRVLEDNAIRLHDGEYAHEHDEHIVFCESANEYAHSDAAVFCENSGTYELCEDTTQLHDGECALTEDVTQLHDGEYALTEDVTQLHDGEYALTENINWDIVKLHSGEYALEDDTIELDGKIYLTDELEELTA